MWEGANITDNIHTMVRIITQRYTGTSCSLQRSRHTHARMDQYEVIGNEELQIAYRDSVFSWMPARMQDLLVEIQRLHSHVLPESAWPPVLRTHLVPWQRPTDLLRFER